MGVMMIIDDLQQAWRKILESFGMCPGYILEMATVHNTPVDPSSSKLVLAHLMDINVNDGEVVLHSEPSDLAFTLMVSKYGQVRMILQMYEYLLHTPSIDY